MAWIQWVKNIKWTGCSRTMRVNGLARVGQRKRQLVLKDGKNKGAI